MITEEFKSVINEHPKYINELKNVITNKEPNLNETRIMVNKVVVSGSNLISLYNEKKIDEDSKKVRQIISDLILRVYEYFIHCNSDDSKFKLFLNDYNSLDPLFQKNLKLKMIKCKNKLNVNDKQYEENLIQKLLFQPCYGKFLQFMTSKNIDVKEFLFLLEIKSKRNNESHVSLPHILHGKTYQFDDELKETKTKVMTYIAQNNDVISIDLINKLFSVFD